MLKTRWGALNLETGEDRLLDKSMNLVHVTSSSLSSLSRDFRVMCATLRMSRQSCVQLQGPYGAKPWLTFFKS